MSQGLHYVFIHVSLCNPCLSESLETYSTSLSHSRSGLIQRAQAHLLIQQSTEWNVTTSEVILHAGTDWCKCVISLFKQCKCHRRTLSTQIVIIWNELTRVTAESDGCCGATDLTGATAETVTVNFAVLTFFQNITAEREAERSEVCDAMNGWQASWGVRELDPWLKEKYIIIIIWYFFMLWWKK